MHLVLIETSGNQRYIFATNKLRENVGASELTHRVGTQFVLEAVRAETSLEIYKDDDLDGRQLRANLLDKSKNPELGKNGNKVEVIIATSGKALLLVEDRASAERIVRKVTSRALVELPGLTVHGAISDGFKSLDEKNDQGEFRLHKAFGEVHRRLEEIRYQMPGNEQRFLRLPYVAPCETSGLPAGGLVFLSSEERKKNRPHKFSITTLVKREALKKDKKNFEMEDEGKPSRIVGLIQRLFGLKLYKNLELLEKDFKDLSWLAVIHADGNGLGEIFLNFDQHTGLKEGKCSASEYVEKYRRFSLALDVCAINAAGLALKALQHRFHNENGNNVGMEIPVVPLILGGDDLTVLCDGQYALRFVYEFLRQFESETNDITKYDYLERDTEGHPLLINGKTVFEILKGVVPEIAGNAFGVSRLGICAGVAIVKPHFPFHQGYELAEQLLKSAKQVKEKIKRRHNNEEVSHPCSALDYHILYDSTASRLEGIRDRMKSDNKETWLYARPYVVSDFDDMPPASEIKEPEWCKNHRWIQLEGRVVAMMARDEDNRRKLPNSQLHTLREALYMGKDETNARTRLINHRYDDQGFNKLLIDPKTESWFFLKNVK
jgi:hypothetical protein